MNTAIAPIDISNMPDLVRLAKEVNTTKQPRLLQADKKTLAVVMPVRINTKPQKKRAKTRADTEQTSF